MTPPDPMTSRQPRTGGHTQGSVTLGQLNACDRGRFVDTVGWVFEHAPWVAERAWEHRPFASMDALHATMSRVVSIATTEEQLELLRAHPDLGTRAGMSDPSAAEQSGAGLDRMSPVAFERLTRLNTAYRTRFGFPFLLAVKGSTTDGILMALEARVRATRDDELGEALRQVARIARFRLEETVADIGKG